MSGYSDQPRDGGRQKTLHQLQLDLLQRQNLLRLRQARQGEDEPDSPKLESDEPPVNTQLFTQADEENKKSQELPGTHYTISEDKTSTSGQRDKLYAIDTESKPTLPQPATDTPSRQQPWGQPRARKTPEFRNPLLQQPADTTNDDLDFDSILHDDSVTETYMDPSRDNNILLQHSSADQTLEHFSPSTPVLGGTRLPVTITNLEADPISTSSTVKDAPNNRGQPDDLRNLVEGFFENSYVSPWVKQPEQANMLQQMMQRIRELEGEIKKLRPDKPITPLNVQVFHRLLDDDSDMAYLSEPDWEVHGEEVGLRGRLPIADPRGYVEHKGNVAFTVYSCYSVGHQQGDIDRAMKNSKPLPMPTPVRHEIVLDSAEMKEAVPALFNQWPKFRTDYPEVDENETLDSPFIWWYHHRRSNDIGQLSTAQARSVAILTDWIEANYAPLYDRVEKQFRRSRVSHWSMEYLVRPGEVLISAAEGRPLGYVATSRPQWFSETLRPDEYQKSSSWKIELRSYIYAGKFLREDTSMTLEIRSESEIEEGEVDIRSLSAMPLRYASSESRDILVQRAKTFWKFRNQSLMSYLGHYETGKYNIAPTVMGSANFNQVDLEVDQLRDVIWNDQAFRSLVADDDMKQLILALVTNQVDADQGTDLIDNKGNGLIMLLHGSPGTGKTFTAESVAEIAKKPLYPVTCGDIGTQPGDVERYLNSVFHLGKVWDCVVLLDEAEVFLEQRTLQDLNRNALVSVFLRALEYYEGILILTTNRVGTFDEAFKSRIQLSLRYERLQRHQRKQIWLNFMSHLKALGEQDRIDFNDIELHIEELAEHPMNGRQIRNSITTGRQLAKYQQMRMTSSHLKRTIAVSEKFEKYLSNVREGVQEKEADRRVDGMYSDEYWARADVIR